MRQGDWLVKAEKGNKMVAFLFIHCLMCIPGTCLVTAEVVVDDGDKALFITLLVTIYIVLFM